MKIIEHFMFEMHNAIEPIMREYYLDEQMLQPMVRQVLKFIRIFLKEIGINPIMVEGFAVDFAHMISYDTAYYYRIVDLLSETRKELMLKNPTKEILRLVELLSQRDNRSTMLMKFKIFSLPLRYALFLPKIKKAFKKALEAIDFTKLQYDEADRYHVRNISGYNFFGMTIEERLKIWPYEQHTYAQIDYSQT